MAAVYILFGGVIGSFAGLFSLMTGASPGAAFGQYILLGHLSILTLAMAMWALSDSGGTENPYL